MPARTLALALAALVLAPACRSTGGGDDPVDLDHAALVGLYDAADPAGVIEIEMDRSGRIFEMEADVPASSLPAAVRAAALERLPGGAITGAERELKKEGRAWEVKMIHEGVEWELVLTGQGDLMETERAVARAEVPAAVLDAAEVAVPGGEVKSVEQIERGMTREYHVKKTIDGVSYKIVLEPGGAVKRAVREHRCELEIPLKK